MQADVFKRLSQLVTEQRRFGMVIVDPPKFARARHSIPEALNGYRRLQSLALKLLDPDGILVFCCCSGLITMELIEELMAQVSQADRREIQILERRGSLPTSGRGVLPGIQLPQMRDRPHRITACETGCTDIK